MCLAVHQQISERNITESNLIKKKLLVSHVSLSHVQPNPVCCAKHCGKALCSIAYSTWLSVTCHLGILVPQNQLEFFFLFSVYRFACISLWLWRRLIVYECVSEIEREKGKDLQVVCWRHYWCENMLAYAQKW